MSPIRIAVWVNQSAHDEAYLKARLASEVGREITVDVARTADELVTLLPDAEVLLTEVFSADWLKAADRLRWVHLNVSGVEKSLGPALIESGVMVTNSRGMHAQHVAEHAVMTMLAIAKDFPRAVRAQVEKRWVYDEILPRSYTLAGKTCGILGLGAIGTEVARLAGALRMHCLATRRNAPAAGSLEGTGLEAVLDPSRLEDVLNVSDFVVVCMPLTRETVGLLDGRLIASMKKGAYLINISRGRILDDGAVLEALRSGHLAGAALDVFAKEPLPADSPYWDAPGVIVTPHVSGNYEAYNRDVADLFARNLSRYASGETLFNLVDKRRGY